MVNPAGNVEQELKPVSDAISEEEYADWLQQVACIKVPREVLLAITNIRQGLKDVAIEGQDVHRNIYVSDRRWKKIVHLMCASAFVHDRDEVNASDLQLAIHCLWNDRCRVPCEGVLRDRYVRRLVCVAIIVTTTSSSSMAFITNWSRARACRTPSSLCPTTAHCLHAVQMSLRYVV